MQNSDDADLYLAEKIDGLEDILAPVAQLGGYITALDSRIALLEDRVANLAHQQHTAIEMPADEAVISTSSPVPPFRLIAIDRWQQKWNAVLEFEGKVKMIEPPSSVAGWQLLTIDPDRRTALFRNESGNEIELPAG